MASVDRPPLPLLFLLCVYNFLQEDDDALKALFNLPSVQRLVKIANMVKAIPQGRYKPRKVVFADCHTEEQVIEKIKGFLKAAGMKGWCRKMILRTLFLFV